VVADPLEVFLATGDFQAFGEFLLLDKKESVFLFFVDPFKAFLVCLSNAFWPLD
jgi:hypothetical protein